MSSVRNEFVVAAPPSRVWEVLTDVARYSEWNPRLPRITGTFALGAVVTLHYARDRAWLPATFVVDVDRFTPERELRWSGPRSAARALFGAAHGFTLSPDAEGTRVVHSEVFSGALAGVLWPLLEAAVAANHAGVNAALRVRCGA